MGILLSRHLAVLHDGSRTLDVEYGAYGRIRKIEGHSAFAYDSVGLVAHYVTATYAFHIFGTDPREFRSLRAPKSVEAPMIGLAPRRRLFRHDASRSSTYGIGVRCVVCRLRQR